MKRILLFSIVILFFASAKTIAQEEGIIKKKKRIELDRGVHIGIGPSLTLGNNIGDYSSGYNLESGFRKRLNSIISLGASVSYIHFRYDPQKTTDDLGQAYVGYNQDGYWDGRIVKLNGGDLNLVSSSFDIKINFVPVHDDSKFSFYGLVKPFISMSSLSKITATIDYYKNNTVDRSPNHWDYVKTSPGEVESEAKFTGGIFVGPGMELNPAGNLSFFAEASFGYTFPITFISTEAYDSTLEDFEDEDFPLATNGFPSMNVSVGISYNF
ncbi:hypothetical protein KK062_29430 [Fulvivirgaceae bacterium PWU5]|uniref:Outer membrane protein beta-barrel domain-containing protein n=1 Tax=Dawidia cretensis TaxID=2782350 RepID=A0AAP2E3I1_9BACT|nr:hypothetical protein [Dawidia cretensis]MBT1712400.1 hypothetical protein [Dawidia cretensis]